MTARKKSKDVLRVYSPELPDLEGEFDALSLANQVYLENCSERFTSLSAEGETRLRALEAITMSLDGLTWRLSLKKGMQFHCGAEVTAADAVQTLVRVLRNETSVSQLHRFVARDKGEPHGFAVYAVSRYRFEIALVARLNDFLARLSLLELSLRHEGRTCFSGLWKVVERDSRGLFLAVHARHGEASLCQYDGVRWERLERISDFRTISDQDPYIYLYAGTQFKSPSEDVLSDEICRPLQGGFSFLVKVEAAGEVRDDIRFRLAQAAKMCFVKNSLWRRAPLTSLLPKWHVLHAPFSGDSGSPPSRRLTVELQVPSDVIPMHMWERLSLVARENQSLDIELTVAGAHGQSRASSGKGIRATVKAVFYAHPADFYTPLCQFEEARDLFTKNEQRSGRVGRRFVEFCQHLPRQQNYVPILFVPFVVRSNRNLGARDDSGLVRFVDMKQSSDRLRKQRVKDATLKALGGALQMFVHDVRRPFSMVQGILGLMEAARTPERLQEIADKYLQDVQKSVRSVDSLIQDILEIGSEAEPICEDLDLAVLVESVLAEIFSVREVEGVELQYEFAHEHLLHMDPQKLARVLTNIVVNAVEAMNGVGTIGFSTQEAEASGFMTLTVWNTNSFIPEDSLSGLFDRFFTEGKKKGTGLGLAIVKKIVNDHGGEVWCESDQQRGTRFILTLPASAKACGEPRTLLPKHASELKPEKGQSVYKNGEEDLKHLSGSGCHRLLLVDDSPVYLDMIRELLSPQEQRAAKVTFLTATSSSEAVENLSRHQVDIAIVDVDLGRDSVNGLQLVRKLRHIRPDLKICVHSNGSPFELQKKVMEAGGDLFLPKPMTRDHLIRLLTRVRYRAEESDRRVAVIDDDALMLETWESQPGFEWISFDSPGDFFCRCDRDTGFLESLACIVTDFTFPGSEETGATLAEKVVARHGDVPIFLATNRSVDMSTLPESIRSTISKDAAVGVTQIEAFLRHRS